MNLATHPLVERLVLDRLEALGSDLLEDDLERVVRTLKDARVGDVERSVTLGVESLGSRESLGTAVLGEVRAEVESEVLRGSVKWGSRR